MKVGDRLCRRGIMALMGDGWPKVNGKVSSGARQRVASGRGPRPGGGKVVATVALLIGDGPHEIEPPPGSWRLHSVQAERMANGVYRCLVFWERP